MALPREPRQKMINMMYLVLTALLALNVSSEILNAFKTVNNSLEKTNEVVSASTDEIMSSLKDKLGEPGAADKAKIWYPKAQQVQNYSRDMYNFLDELKKKIMTGAKYDPASDKDKGIDNLDVTTRIMVDKGDGKLLRSRLDEYKKNMLAVDPEIAKYFATSLPINTEMPKTKNKSNKTWEAAYFHMVPTVATLTILSKFQNDIKTSENKVVSFCHEQVGKVKVQQDSYAALAIANTTNALPGQEIEITAGVGGFSKAISPKISIGGRSHTVGDDGAVHYKFKADRLGSNSIPVLIEYTDQNGQVQKITKTVEYVVGQSSAAVQLDNMNVLFIGVDNPVTISGSGSVDQIKASISGGGGVLSGGGAKRTVRVSQETDECYITVLTPDGKSTRVQFRVRSIPDPTPMIGTFKSGNIPAAQFKGQQGVRAVVENFYYKTQFNVTSFRMTGDGNGFDDIMEANNTGAAWNEAQNIVNRSRAGSFITIEDIYAVGPDGRRRKLTPLILYLK
ncbi:MAG TPA: gliding motility protein GldM [Chitinophagaceae bacterium]|nr:gliding motility protein GldM [Chitinophagaceae bacterium]